MADTLAILGGEPIRKEPYPPWPEYDERDIAAVTSVIKSRRWGGFPYPGPESERFMHRFAAMQGGGYPVLMANGTVTLEVALRAADIGWGDEVIVPACTFQATAAAPMAAGAIPVIVDIDPDTYTISPEAIEQAITSRTKAIIPVHLGAQMADMDAIMDIAQRYNLVVIEDAAHAHGARWRGQGAGTIGDFGSFSLQSSKILTTGEGGVLLCKTPELAARAASIVDCGRAHDPERKVYTMGANYRMTELQAALGNVGLDRFEEQARQREEMADYMDSLLADVPGVRVLKRDPRLTRRSFYRYIFAIDPDIFLVTRDAVVAALIKEGIPAEDGYPPMHRYELFRPQRSRLPVPSAFPEYFDFENMHFPVAEQCQRESVWLNESIFRAGPKGVEDVVAALRKILEYREDLKDAEEEIRRRWEQD